MFHGATLGYARYVQQLPASEAYHHAAAGSMLDHASIYGISSPRAQLAPFAEEVTRWYPAFDNRLHNWLHAGRSRMRVFASAAGVRMAYAWKSEEKSPLGAGFQPDSRATMAIPRR